MNRFYFGMSKWQGFILVKIKGNSNNYLHINYLNYKTFNKKKQILTEIYIHNFF